MDKIKQTKIKGLIQLGVVITFIGGAFIVSSLLQTQKPSLHNNGNGERAIFVETQDITPAPYRIEFDATGTIETRANVTIVPQVSGRIINVNPQFFEGGLFKKGDVLFEVEPRDFEIEVQRFEADLARAKTALNIEKAESNAALEEWRLLNGDKAAPSLVSRDPQRAEAKANLKSAQAQLENAQLDLERTRYILPFDGRVISSAISEGQYVAQGQEYGSVFDLSGYEVHAFLEDQKLEWLLTTEALDIEISVDYLGATQSYTGLLKRGAATLNAQTRFAQVSFGLEGDTRDLIPGIFATIRIKGDTINNIALLPASALQKGNVVWLVTADDTLTKITPEIVYNNGTHIALSNITGTTRIVTSKAAGALEGAKTIINNVDSESELNDEGTKDE
jgi:RND family efflux transporter MFP subunit